MSEPTFYTHAEWRVRAGEEEAFVAARRRLSDAFSALASPPQWGTLLRSESDPRLFYSFGPWERPEDIAAMRADPDAQRAIERVVACASALLQAPLVEWRTSASSEATHHSEGRSS